MIILTIRSINQDSDFIKNQSKMLVETNKLRKDREEKNSKNSLKKM